MNDPLEQVIRDLPPEDALRLVCFVLDALATDEEIRDVLANDVLELYARLADGDDGAARIAANIRRVIGDAS